MSQNDKEIFILVIIFLLSIYYLSGGFFMKRLVDYNDKIINNTVLQYYGVEYSSQRDLSDIDRHFAHAIMQALKHSVYGKYPNADKDVVKQYVGCLIRYVLHIDIDVALLLTQDLKYIGIYRYLVNLLRRSLIKDYAADNRLSNEEIYAIVIKRLLRQLEELFFKN